MDDHEIERMYRLEGQYWWFVARRYLVRTLLTRWRVPAGALVVDAGCGAGGSYIALGRHWHVLGLDMSPTALSLCRRRGMQMLVGGDVTAMPLADDIADAVVSCDVLEHIHDDTAALRELRRIVKPGGLLVLTVPALPWLWSEHDEALNHVRRYTRPELAARLLQAGWKSLWLNYAVSLLLPPIAMFRIYRRKRRTAGAPRVDLFELPPLLNRTLTGICLLDSWLAARLPMPPGASLVAVARKEAS